MSFLTARGVKASLATAALTILPVSANAATTMLQSNDYVGISFWTISMAMVAATVFFLMEAGRMGGKWRTSLTSWRPCHFGCSCSLLLHEGCLGIHGESPTVYRYVDWLITVPLQMVEFLLHSCGCHSRQLRRFLAFDDWLSGDASSRLHG